jgi:hypothetical protein
MRKVGLVLLVLLAACKDTPQRRIKGLWKDQTQLSITWNFDGEKATRTNNWTVEARYKYKMIGNEQLALDDGNQVMKLKARIDMAADRLFICFDGVTDKVYDRVKE